MKGLWVFGLMIMGLVILGTSVSAFGFMRDNDNVDIENQDYETWRQAHIEMLSEEHFNEMKAMHANRGAFHEEREAHFEEVQAALNAGDYQAWLQARQDMPGYNAEMDLTENDFNTLVQIHELRDTLPEDFQMHPGRRMHIGQGRMFS